MRASNTARDLLGLSGGNIMIGVHLLLLVFACHSIRAQMFDYLSDYPPFYPLDSEQETLKYRKPELVRRQRGSDMVLKCTVTSCQYHKHKIAWEFKACSNSKKNPCTTFQWNNKAHIENHFVWTKLPGQLLRKKCVYVLELRNVSHHHDGLYRCIDDNRMVKVFQVEVTDIFQNSTEMVVVIPSNITIGQNMQAIIQCKVHSKHRPAIWWFKQSDGSNYDIEYSDKYYNRINTTVQVHAMPQEMNIYLSKLNIQHAREVDSGVYVCVATTERGTDYRDAVVNVMAKPTQWEPHSSFFLLFLIPVAFALIPITAWLCYFRKKKKDKKMVYRYNHQDLIRPIISDRVVVL